MSDECKINKDWNGWTLELYVTWLLAQKKRRADPEFVSLITCFGEAKVAAVANKILKQLKEKK